MPDLFETTCGEHQEPEWTSLHATRNRDTDGFSMIHAQWPTWRAAYDAAARPGELRPRRTPASLVVLVHPPRSMTG